MANFGNMQNSLNCKSAGGDSKGPLENKNLTESGDMKTLKTKLANLEDSYEKLVFENEQTNLDLEHEKRKVLQLERQLQFVKDNQTVFEKLKDTYISMKYNKAAGRKLVEIRDKSVQTWDGVLCRACLDTEKLRNELEQLKNKYDNCIFVKKDEIERMAKTIQSLKNSIQTQLEPHLTKQEMNLVRSVSYQRRTKRYLRSRSAENFSDRKDRRRRCGLSKSSINF